MDLPVELQAHYDAAAQAYREMLNIADGWKVLRLPTRVWFAEDVPEDIRKAYMEKHQVYEAAQKVLHDAYFFLEPGTIM